MVTLISHTGIEVNDLMHSDSVSYGLLQTIGGLIYLPLAGKYIKIMRQKTSFELAMYFALDMNPYVPEEPDEVTQLCWKGCCTAILFIATLFTLEVPDQGVVEMEQAWNHRKPFRTCCLGLVSSGPCLSLGNKRIPSSETVIMKPNKTGMFYLGLSLCSQFAVSLEGESESACGVVVWVLWESSDSEIGLCPWQRVSLYWAQIQLFSVLMAGPSPRIS